MNYGLFTLYLILAFGLGIAMKDHGKPKKGEHSFWISLISTLIYLTIIWWAVGWRLI